VRRRDDVGSQAWLSGPLIQIGASSAESGQVSPERGVPASAKPRSIGLAPAPECQAIRRDTPSHAAG